MYLCFFERHSPPLYLALYDFFGNNTIWSSLDLKGKKASTGNPNKGVYYDNSISQGFVNPAFLQWEVGKSPFAQAKSSKRL